MPGDLAQELVRLFVLHRAGGLDAAQFAAAKAAVLVSPYGAAPRGGGELPPAVGGGAAAAGRDPGRRAAAAAGEKGWDEKRRREDQGASSSGGKGGGAAAAPAGRFGPHQYNAPMLDPRALRFSQWGIGGQFRNGGNVFDAVKLITSGQLDPSSFPPIEVFRWPEGVPDGEGGHGCDVFSADNRRLWVYKQAGVSAVRVRWVPLARVAQYKLSTSNGGASARIQFVEATPNPAAQRAATQPRQPASLQQVTGAAMWRRKRPTPPVADAAAGVPAPAAPAPPGIGGAAAAAGATAGGAVWSCGEVLPTGGAALAAPRRRAALLARRFGAGTVAALDAAGLAALEGMCEEGD